MWWRFAVAWCQIRRVRNWRHEVMAFVGNVVRARALLKHSVRIVGIVFVARLRVGAAYSETSAFLNLPVIMSTWQARVARFARIHVLLTITRCSLTAMLAKLVWFANDEVIDRVQLCLLDLKAADAVLGMSRSRWSLARLISHTFPFTLMTPSRAASLVRLRMPLVLIQTLLNRLRCIFGFIWWFGVLLENLQFGQWDDITILWLVPDGFLRGAVVVVEAICLRVV